MKYLYNEFNLLVEIQEPDDEGTGFHTKASYTYDRGRRITSSTDALGRVTQYFYDRRDRVVLTQYFDGSTELIFYGTDDKNKNLVVMKKDRNGNTTQYDYDTAGRMTSKVTGSSIMNAYGTEETFVEGSKRSFESFTYLQATDLVLTHNVDGDVTEYQYDYRNRVIGTTVSPRAK